MKVEFEKKLADYAVQRKIEQSASFNKTKIKKMIQRNNFLEKIKKETAEKLASMAAQDKPKYKALTRSLILQGLLKLMEPEVIIKCRKSDVEMVKELVEDLRTTYIEKVTSEVPKFKGTNLDCKILVDESEYLPEFHDEESGLASCLGGVELKAHRNRIVCNNTLEARLELCYQEALPEIRDILFINNP
eukprot:TRINITY_DN2049_c0_g3_i1.p1 TRINITY_DN2049_c0_g3~~TRINITY_DN2049_c0_g3_i1.p1  ORF type:complete len:189 (+),score=84.07 TRINITY_DN2049_c0_g3_i1:187-753(+)